MTGVKMIMFIHWIHCVRVKTVFFVLLSLDGSAACHKINILCRLSLHRINYVMYEVKTEEQLHEIFCMCKHNVFIHCEVSLLLILQSSFH